MDDAPNYNKKLNEYTSELPGRMYIFEITKFCGYSTFVCMYKDETLTDLYTRVSHHFCCRNIKGLYIKNDLYRHVVNNSNNSINNTTKNCCCFDKNMYIPVPITSVTRLKEFVFENAAREPRNLEPVYPLPSPVVYRIYLDDGHCHIC
jgi:hypothetical protein